MSAQSPSGKNKKRIREIASDEIEKNGYYAAIEMFQKQAEKMQHAAEEYEKAGALDENGEFRLRD